MAKGQLIIQCFDSGNSYIPVNRCKVTVTPTGADGVPVAGATNIELSTNSSGQTETVDLEAPPLENSETPGKVPYSFADILIERDGYTSTLIKGAQIYPNRVAWQQFNLNSSRNRRDNEVIDIPANTLVGNFPPKIPEAEEKVLPKPQGTVVLPKPVVPEFITVHAGSPNDNSAPNYKVEYKDYVKNVASCEIYSTWSENTIRANVYAIVSFTLNRIYTEWYRGKGKSFDITNSTAYDHAFSYGRNIFDNISRIVDDIFSTYIKRFSAKQPLLTQYCDGERVKCPGWMTQWGSKYLGDQGKTPYEILSNFYGNDIELVQAEKVKGSPQSWPGSTLKVGSTGESVKTIQEQLNGISKAYPLIPKQSLDGKYGEPTKEAVKVFQDVFKLSQTGEVDYATWYAISDIYVGVSKIAELRSSVEEQKRIFYPPIMIDEIKNVPHIPYYN